MYADVKENISEKTITSPSSLHGLMHLTREEILKYNFNKILCILRPTIIYGAGDSHNGYGPNRFVNCALRNNSISIFGSGEERRDHIFIEDLVKIHQMSGFAGSFSFKLISVERKVKNVCVSHA